MGHGGYREGAGRKARVMDAASETFYLPGPYREYIDGFDGTTRSQKLINALDLLERFFPNGPQGTPARDARGRFLKHEPVLVARSVRHLVPR